MTKLELRINLAERSGKWIGGASIKRGNFSTFFRTMITDYYKMAKKSSTNIRKRKRKSTKSKTKQKKAKKVDYKKRIYRKIKKGYSHWQIYY